MMRDNPRRDSSAFMQDTRYKTRCRTPAKQGWRIEFVPRQNAIGSAQKQCIYWAGASSAGLVAADPGPGCEFFAKRDGLMVCPGMGPSIPLVFDNMVPASPFAGAGKRSRENGSAGRCAACGFVRHTGVSEIALDPCADPVALVSACVQLACNQ